MFWHGSKVRRTTVPGNRPPFFLAHGRDDRVIPWTGQVLGGGQASPEDHYRFGKLDELAR